MGYNRHKLDSGKWANGKPVSIVEWFIEYIPCHWIVIWCCSRHNRYILNWLDWSIVCIHIGHPKSCLENHKMFLPSQATWISVCIAFISCCSVAWRGVIWLVYNQSWQLNTSCCVVTAAILFVVPTLDRGLSRCYLTDLTALGDLDVIRWQITISKSGFRSEYWFTISILESLHIVVDFHYKQPIPNAAFYFPVFHLNFMYMWQGKLKHMWHSTWDHCQIVVLVNHHDHLGLKLAHHTPLDCNRLCHVPFQSFQQCSSHWHFA